MNTAQNARKWLAKSKEELAEATRQFDDPSYAPPAATPLPGLKRRHEDAIARLRKEQDRRGPGRPRTGRGFRRLSISIERGLLEQADAYARAHKLTRSQMIAQALADVIRKAG